VSLPPPVSTSETAGELLDRERANLDKVRAKVARNRDAFRSVRPKAEASFLLQAVLHQACKRIARAVLEGRLDDARREIASLEEVERGPSSSRSGPPTH
jgi:hypothetical protein